MVQPARSLVGRTVMLRKLTSVKFAVIVAAPDESVVAFPISGYPTTMVSLSSTVRPAAAGDTRRVTLPDPR